MARVPTTVEAVLAAIKSRVLAYCPTSLPDAADAWLTLASDEDVRSNPPHDRFVTVTPRDFQAEAGVVAGAGAGLFVAGSSAGTAGLVPLTGTVEVALWLRLLVDEQSADDAYLAAQLGLWRAVLGALQLYDPAAAGGPILSEPMRLARFSSRPRRPRADWGKLESLWDVRFVCELPAAGG